MLEYVVFSIARLARGGAGIISDVVEACNNAIDTISNTTLEWVEEPNLESQDIEGDWVEVSLIGK